jgi:hypothetical protein
MLDIRFDTGDLSRLNQRLSLLTEKNLRYAVAQAMTNAAKDAQQHLSRVTPDFVDRPTPFTLNSTYVRFANPSRLTAEVGFKQFATKGTPAGQYLNPMARGGDRQPKRSELVLRRAGILSSGQFIVPMRPWQGDPYGNVPRGTMSMMLSQLKSYTGSLSYLNASNSRASQRKRTTAGQFFLSNSRRSILYRKPDGRRDQVETAFMILDDAPNQERRFPIPRILNDQYARSFDRHIQTTLANELRRAGFS